MSEIQETLQSIARKGMEECYELGKVHGAILELEKIKEKIDIECDSVDSALDIIIDRISELKGEQK